MLKEITSEEFKELIFDYENEKEWNYKGDKPALIDYWAPWCGPCKMVGPILEELAEEYPDINIYKVNVDDNPEVSQTFGIQSIPSLLFVPLDDKPQMAQGALPKTAFEEAIKEILIKQN